MRTTLDIADDVLFAAKDFARRDKKTLGQVISEWGRTALQNSAVQQKVVSSKTKSINKVIIINSHINKSHERKGVSGSYLQGNPSTSK